MRALILLVLAALSFALNAETAVCTGNVNRIAYHAPDGFYLAIGNTTIFKVCSPQNQYFRTSPESCKLIASLATTARATGKELQVYIDNAPTTSCTDITAWFGADVRFVELKK